MVSPTRRRALPRGLRVLTALLALWSLGTLPLLALPIDWSFVCGCDACPLSGGPSCCCKSFPTWANADGSPGKRAAITHPSVGKDQQGCVGPASVSSAELRAHPPWLCDQEATAPPAGTAARGRRPSLALRLLEFPSTLPRPPPGPWSNA